MLKWLVYLYLLFLINPFPIIRMVQLIYSTRLLRDTLMLCTKQTLRGPSKLMISFLMPIVHGAIGQVTSPVGQPSKDMYDLLTDTYRLYIVHLCTAIYGKIM